MNNFVIEQTPEDTKLAVSLHQKAEIGTVRLARAKIAADSPEESVATPIDVSMSIKAKRIDSRAEQLFIEVTFKLTGTKKNGAARAKNAVCLECGFEISYRLQPGFQPDDEQVRAFKDGNAIFNCWPYCREFVHNAMTRMGYPPITLPFLRVMPTRKKNASGQRKR
jgi:preprotein translocase subunit SecB